MGENNLSRKFPKQKFLTQNPRFPQKDRLVLLHPKNPHPALGTGFLLKILHPTISLFVSLIWNISSSSLYKKFGRAIRAHIWSREPGQSSRFTFDRSAREPVVLIFLYIYISLSLSLILFFSLSIHNLSTIVNRGP